MRFSQGGGISLEPVYAVDALYKENSTSHITADATGATENTATATKWKLTVIDSGLKIGGIDLGLTNTNAITIGSNTITETDVGNWKSVYSTVGDNNTNGTLAYKTQKISYNATTGTTVDGQFTVNGAGAGIYVEDNDGNHVQITSSDVIASNSVHATNTIASGINARMEGGKVVAQNGLYIGYTSDQITDASYDNSRFAVNGENGSFKAADGKFEVSNSGAITADSLKLTGTDGTENVGTAIKTNARNIEINKNSIDTLNGKVNGHDTEINTLKTKTEGITRVDGNSTTVDGVNFKEGAVVAAGVAANSITANNFVTVGDTTNGYVHMTKEGIAVSGRLYSSLDHTAADLKSVSVAEMANTRDNTNKISYNDTEGTKIDSDVIINAGKKNQVKITEGEGIVVGLNSSVINDDGVFAGGHDYDNAKAAFNANDGSIKGANGKFTVDKDGALKAADEKFGVDKDGNVTTEGALKGKTLGIGTNGSEFTVDENGNTNVGGTLDVTGATTLGSTLNVTGKTTLNDELQVDKTATFGSATGSQTVIEGGNIKADGMLTSASAKIGSVGIDNTGAITGVTSLTTNALTVTGAFTTGNLTVNGDLTASGAINGKTISINDGGSIAGVKFATDGNLTATTGKIGGVSFAASGVVSGVNDFTSTIIRDGAGTIITSGNVKSNTANIGAIRIDNEQIEGSSASGLTIENVKIKDGVVSDVTSLTADKATIGGVNTLDNNGIRVATGKNIQVGVNTKIEDGSIAVSTNTKLTDQALNLNTTNTWTAAGGLVADKATVNGVVLGADGDTGKATFTDANGSTTIAGKNITTGKIIADELLIDKISLGKNGSSNISIDNSGNVTTEGEITIKDATGAVMSKLSQDKATFGKDAMNQTTISKGDITATAKNAADSQQSTLTHNNKGFKVEGKDAGGTKASSFGFDTSTGIGTFTGQDNSTTAINGSKMTLVNGDNRTELTAGGVTFTGKDYKDATAKGTTVIDGNTITTGKLVTDELVITGKGNADGNGGSIAFGGNGTIKSDINDGTTNGKNTSFETTLYGVNTKVTDGTTTTENKVTAAGNSNTVTKDEKYKSEFNQGLTSIGGVVTNGTINVAQNLDGVNGLLTNEVTDADGKSSMLKQSGTGLTYTDSANTGNETRINSSDVSIGSASDPDKRINLSDLGQIDELDQEIRNNEEYQNNKTAVGGINAEAAIRRGEVERLDNRISEEVTRLDGRINDVNDRVNKVGAMAAAIASLKSIGYDPQAPSEFSIGLGQYKGETGVAMGFFHYPNKNFMINVSLSTAGGETMGGIGATWRFGHKSPQKLLEEQREAQAKKELAAAEKYQAAAKLAKEAQERAEYAAKLARQAQVSADNAKAAADATQAKHFG